MDLTGRDIQERQFHDAWRGYNQEEVDDFLDKIAEALDRLQRDNDALATRVRELDQMVATSRDTEEMLKKTLVTAQQAAEEAIASAKRRAEHLIAEAEERVQRANEEARERLAEMEADLRRKAMEADREYARKKREAQETVETLRRFERELSVRLREFLEGQLGALDALTEAAGNDPAVTRPAVDPVGGGVGVGGEGSPADEREQTPVQPPAWDEPVWHEPGRVPAPASGSPAGLDLADDDGSGDVREMFAPDESDRTASG